jgi:hypothetical protein
VKRLGADPLTRIEDFGGNKGALAGADLYRTYVILPCCTTPALA